MNYEIFRNENTGKINELTVRLEIFDGVNETEIFVSGFECDFAEYSLISDDLLTINKVDTDNSDFTDREIEIIDELLDSISINIENAYDLLEDEDE